jgi:hypothetical protein
MRRKLGIGLGLLVSVGLIGGILSVAISTDRWSYEGYCAGFDPYIRECGLPEYLLQLSLIMLLAGSFPTRIVAWAVLLVAISLPIAGDRIGNHLDLRTSS